MRGHALTIAQHDDGIGNVQQLFEKMTDVNHPDSGIAQASDDFVEAIDFGGVQRRRWFIKNENARVLQQRACDFD